MVDQRNNNRNDARGRGGGNQRGRKYPRLTEKEREERAKQQHAQALEDWKPKKGKRKS